jgi:hypothetical protein
MDDISEYECPDCASSREQGFKTCSLHEITIIDFDDNPLKPAVSTEDEIRADERRRIVIAIEAARQHEGLRAQRIFAQCITLVTHPDYREEWRP